MLKTITRSITIAALFLIPIFPLIVVDQFFFPFITGKAFYFRILVEIAFASWLILAFIDAQYRPRLNAITLGVTAFAVVTLIADLLGVNPMRSFWSNFERMEGWLVILHLWMFYIVASSTFVGAGNTNAVATRIWWHRWLNVFLLVGVAVSYYGIGQLLGWYEIHQGSVRIDASLGNAAYMAVYMLMNAGVAAYMFIISRHRGGYLHWVYAILFVVFSYLLFQTATRGTIIGFAGGSVLALLLYAIFAEKKYKRSRQLAGGVLALIVLLGVVFWFNRDQAFVQNNEVLKRLASISWSETQTQARSFIWPMALEGFTQRPVFGWGQENFNYIFNAEYNPKMWTHEQWFDRAHSVFLDWLVASGIVGFLAYVSLYVLALVIVWRSYLRVSEKAVLTGLIAGYAVHNVFVFDNLASYVAFFAVLAFIGSAFSNYEATGSGKKQKLHAAGSVIGGNRVFDEEVVRYVVAPASIVLLVLGFYFFSYRPIMANTALISALYSCNAQNPTTEAFKKVFEINSYMANQEAREQLINCATGLIQGQAPMQSKQDFYQLTQQAIENQIAISPRDARMYVIGGSFLSTVGQIPLALPILEKAHALSPGKQVVEFELANIYLTLGQNEKAVALLEKAYKDDPSYPQAKTAYALGLVLIGKEAEAKQQFGNDPSIFESAQAAQVYASTKQYDRAIALYTKLIAADPSNVNLKGGLAQAYYAAGRKLQAIEYLRKIAVDHPEFKAQIDQTIAGIQTELR